MPDNIDKLVELLNISENILKYNSEIENDIKENEGTILYSYNNIIIASEISDSLYQELQKNPHIEFMELLPLKKYGEVDINVVNQLDISKIFIGESLDDLGIITTNEYTSGNKNITLTGTTGATYKNEKIVYNESVSGSVKNLPSGVAPTITNTIFTLTAATNETFNYTITVTGTTPISFQLIKPDSYTGNLSLNGNIVSGTATKYGNYNIKIIANNNFGTDDITLLLTITEPVMITNTNLNVYNILGTKFTYAIESNGSLPKIYDMTNVPELSGQTLNDNIITGTFTTEGKFDMGIIVSGLTNWDYKVLTINVGKIPIITSPGEISRPINEYFVYLITSTESGSTKYSIVGDLARGLNFKINEIYGYPNYVDEVYVTIKATNPYGQSSKILKITIYQ